jgi:hypothetical protein
MRPPLEHRYTLEGQPYCLREALFEGQRRIAQRYALSLTLATPTTDPVTGQPLAIGDAQWAAYSRTLEQVDGGNLYAKAVLQECLVEAPDFWWQVVPALPGSNGAATRTLTFAQITPGLWLAQRQEVEAFLQATFRADQPDDAPASGGGPQEPALVAGADPLPPVFRGRAE